MYYGKINDHDIANGTGVRVSLFVSGCRHHCPGCFNKETWNFEYGKPYTEETQKHILKLLEPDYISGITVLGGEPLEPENIHEVGNLLESVYKTFGFKKNTWLYTGFDFEMCMKALNDPAVERCICNCDVVVDGPFIEAEKDITLKFRGSRNQRIIDVQKSLETGGVVLWNLS